MSSQRDDFLFPVLMASAMVIAASGVSVAINAFKTKNEKEKEQVSSPENCILDILSKESTFRIKDDELILSTNVDVDNVSPDPADLDADIHMITDSRMLRVRNPLTHSDMTIISALETSSQDTQNLKAEEDLSLEEEFSSEANSYSRIPTEIHFKAKGQKNKDVISQKAFEELHLELTQNDSSHKRHESVTTVVTRNMTEGSKSSNDTFSLNLKILNNVVTDDDELWA